MHVERIAGGDLPEFPPGAGFDRAAEGEVQERVKRRRPGLCRACDESHG